MLSIIPINTTGYPKEAFDDNEDDPPAFDTPMKTFRAGEFELAIGRAPLRPTAIPIRWIECAAYDADRMLLYHRDKVRKLLRKVREKRKSAPPTFEDMAPLWYAWGMYRTAQRVAKVFGAMLKYDRRD